ncbi:1,3,7-trimethyluric acid N-methyltransferase CkTcS-like [Syzygium oleosum]|uniref:1,3,7-trimethyluric acid N-methyltransferase CkTcS-like n=1 Tax=Syzygium oleosum TaxID=219896 RepID=UPI0024B961BD|nr:1,3,7-trimethyluric acid N-methyltransferase CkTcS-like [Syzygium oleosum]
MDGKEVLFMSKGDGEHSYAQTSTFTQKVASLAKPTIASTVDSLLEEGFFLCELLNVADLGCALGPSTETFMSTVIESVQKKCAHSNCSMPEFQLYLDDLLGNDFNTLFKSLSNFSQNYESLSCCIMGAPGSFHRRLFPRNCLHLANSSYGVHWLSQVPNLMSEEGFPLNKGRIYISKTNPSVAKEAYLAQFRADFSTFWKCRGEEMVDNGRLVLILNGREDKDSASTDGYFFWEKLGEAIADLVSEGGFVKEDKLDTLNVPYHTASSEEVRSIVDEEGSFEIEYLEIMGIDRTLPDEDPHSRGRKMAKDARSFTGSIISYHLGEGIMDKLYGEKLPIIIGDDLAKGRRKGISLVLVLKKHVP